MVKIYYHIYAVKEIDFIINDQINLIEKFFQFPFILNIGISVPKENNSIVELLNRFYNYSKLNYRIRDVRVKGNEFVTLDLIETDCKNGDIKDDDYILYLHTKGASYLQRGNTKVYENARSWSRIMEYFLIERYKDVFKIFDKTDFNTYGIFLQKPLNIHYSGNFWWAKGSLLKTIRYNDINKISRYDAEARFIQLSDNWKPYCAYNESHNLYGEIVPRNIYAK